MLAGNKKKILNVAALLLLGLWGSIVWAQKVSLVYDNASAQASYAAKKLTATLLQQGYQLSRSSSDYDFMLSFSVHPERLSAEAFQIIPQGRVITIYGGDNRGMIYGVLALVEQVEQGIKLAAIQAQEEKPAMAFRGIKYNLPWETYRPSSALDQHIPTARDPKYWEAFLDMMVANRFNVVSLWNMNPYTYMIKAGNFPEGSPWSEREHKKWQALYRDIFRMAKERALDTYIVHWSIFFSKEFSEAHQLAGQNYYPHYYVEGDTSELVRRYLRESVRQTLEEYPDLDGIGISHGEGMAGMTPLERQQWMDDVLIAGMLEADRPVKIIHRVPFSSGKSSDPGVSKNVEEVTRAAMEKLEDRFEGPIWVEMKFNWSHGHSTPKLEKVHGGKLGDTYFDPLPENYKVVWQIRNEDFFALRWGVPSFIRQHIALNGKAAYVGGYFIGSETYIPALDYFTADSKKKSWRWAFERQWLFYKLWGRLLYNPETPDAVFENEFVHRYGEQAKNLLNAYSLASSTQLRFASLYDSRWDFTIYSEGLLALMGDYMRYITVDDLIAQPTMASEYVNVEDYVASKIRGEGFSVDRVTPPILAANLKRDCLRALALVENIKVGGNVALEYEVADIKAWSLLGLHLAEKIRGALALQAYRLQGNQTDKDNAINHLQNGLAYWDELVALTRPLYKDMRLTHYNHNFFEANDDNLFHWALIRHEVAEDVKRAREAVYQAANE